VAAPFREVSDLNLEELGWQLFFAENFAPYAREGYSVGRVFLQHNRIYLLRTAEGEVWGEVTGRMRYEARGRENLPAVGDWVVIRELKEEGKATIHDILPRKSKFSRKVAGSRTEEQVVAANIDTLFLVTGLDNDFNLRRIERYLIMAWESGARPVIILNKADVCGEIAPQHAREVKGIASDVPVLLMSAKCDEGWQSLLPFVGPGQTVSLIGSSGVGKSTIVNRLLGSEAQRTQAVRGGDDRGKHTTTHRELIMLPSGGLIIDTPGMRELQLLVSDKGIRDAFEDIENLIERCRFGDCRHADEPGCAIKEALTGGTLDPERFRNYEKMGQEMAELAAKQSLRTSPLEKERRRKIPYPAKKPRPRR